MMNCVRSFLTVIRHNRDILHSLRPLTVNRCMLQQQRCNYSNFTSQIEENADQTVIDICKGDAVLEKKLRVLMLEVEVMRQDGRYAPDHIQKDQWEHLVELQSKSQRAKYLRYLFKVEKSKENSKAKKEARRKETPVVKPEVVKENEDDLIYSVQHQSLFVLMRDASVNKFDNYRALQAMMHGQSLVIDCSYDDDMVYKEALNAANQVTILFGENRIHREPFNMHLCNLNMKGRFMQQLRKMIPSLDEPWFPLNLHTKSYLDFIPKEKLVYLTPHCRQELAEFDHDAVYIIGCMVNKRNDDPLSLARAKRDGLKMAKLPLDRYLELVPGCSKNLNINHMVPILLDLKLTSDWKYSLRHVPRRKLMETKINAMENNPKMRDHVINAFRRKSNNFTKKKFNSLVFRDTRNNYMSFNQQKLKLKKSLYDGENI